MNDAVAYHSAIAADFDSKYTASPAFRERLAVWDALIARHCPENADVLDAGCGSGALAALAAPRAQSFLGFDGSAEMVALAKARVGERANVRFAQASMGDSAVLDGRSFDLILSSSVLEYIADWQGALGWLAAALRPGGILVFSTPNPASLYRKAERAAFALTRRPTYYEHVRSAPSDAVIDAALDVAKLVLVERRYYAAAPLLSPVARALGVPRWADTLGVTVARRAQ